jgi:hypothetical protein
MIADLGMTVAFRQMNRKECTVSGARQVSWDWCYSFAAGAILSQSSRALADYGKAFLACCLGKSFVQGDETESAHLFLN